MKKIILSLLLAEFLVLCCACTQNAPVSTSAAQSAQPTPVSSGAGTDTVEPYKAATQQEAVQFLTKMPPKAFDLPEPFDNYEVNFVEEASVEGSDCYRMELEVSYPDGIEVLTLFIRTDLGVMYHYDDETGSYHEITPYNYYCPQESKDGDNGGAQNSTARNDVPEASNEGVQGYPEGGDEAAISHLKRYSKDDLDLPAELGEYVVRVDGEMEVEGIRCYAIGVYADLGERMELMGTYYVAFDNSVVYATDLQTGGYKALPAK